MRGQAINALRYAVRGRVLLKYLGQLLVGLGALSVIPSVAAAVLGEPRLALRLAALAVGTGVVGLLWARLRVGGHLQVNEALAVSALIFLISPLLLSVAVYDPEVGYLDTLFEAVSGVTTTGLTTLASVQARSDAYLFARAWVQWYGGLGIVVLVLALMSGTDGAARRLTDLGEQEEDLVGSTHAHARRALVIYLGLTVFGLLVIWIGGMEAFPALLHTLTAVSTAGYSAYDQSLEALPARVQYAVLVVSLTGAVSIPLYYRLYRRDLRGFAGNLQFGGLIAAAVLVSVLLALSLAVLEQRPWGEALSQGVLLGVSAQSTTGFSTTDVGELHPASKLILVLSMFVGGDFGSTAGGIKILRLLIVLRLAQLLVLRACMPSHAVLEPRLGGHRLGNQDVERALLIVLLYVGLIVLTWIPFVAFAYDPLEALFEVTSAATTTGLSTGITRPELEPVLKLVLCAGMLAGRLEILALLVVFYPGAWHGKRSKA
jgi:trk system potassium uptake protein